MAKKEDETPLMKQYNAIKAKYPGALLLFRVGDFYETFGEDAVKTSQILGIVLTKRANGAASHIELAGFPHHALDTYLPKLVRAGQRVAICDQLEDPKLTKKIVKRGVTELITPGLSYNDKILEHKFNNYLASVFFDNNSSGVAFLDISTGEFMVAEGSIEYIEKLIQGLKPAEVITSKDYLKKIKELLGEKYYVYALDNWIYTEDYTREKLQQHFNTIHLKGFGIDHMSLAVIAAGVCLHYLTETHHENTRHIRSISRIEEEQYVWLDSFTIRNLEIVSPMFESGRSLLQVIDKTVTPMGARLLRKWTVLPLKNLSIINERHHVVSYAYQQQDWCNTMLDQMAQMGDLERMVSRLAMKRITPRELVQLQKSLSLIDPIKASLLASTQDTLLKKANGISDMSWVVNKIASTLKPDASAYSNKGNIILEGVDKTLDELREISFSGKDYLLKIQQQEQEKTGIPSLKISYNNVFGYYIEVTHTHRSKVPADWIRKQTLANAERYITDELKQYEEKILGAEEKIIVLEERIFSELIISLADFVSPMLTNAALMAELDCLLSFARLSLENSYTRPELTEEFDFHIKDARHPVIEKQLPPGEKYITNDIYLNNSTQQFIVLTGPNMSGKSALLRQTALIAIMAQIGCFVPASYCKMGYIDKIFTRVGASDNISSGESTFMVEMTETASILNNLSARSLILLDEIGRGTSTYDGVSIAWAIAEFIYHHPSKPKAIFATHYHELNQLEEMFQGIKNFHIDSKEHEHKIIFLRKLVEGGSEHSFGIHVARMAGVPQTVVQKAQQILSELENQRDEIGTVSGKKVKMTPPMQLSMFEINDPVFEQIRKDLNALDINTLSPVEALIKLSEIKKQLQS